MLEFTPDIVLGIMDMFDIFKKKKVKKEQLAAKDAATAKGEPYIDVVSVELEYDKDGNITGLGMFDLDWNDIFVARLIKSRYTGKTDADVVDNWFHDVCRNIVMETFEQEIADPTKRF